MALTSDNVLFCVVGMLWVHCIVHAFTCCNYTIQSKSMVLLKIYFGANTTEKNYKGSPCRMSMREVSDLCNNKNTYIELLCENSNVNLTDIDNPISREILKLKIDYYLKLTMGYKNFLPSLIVIKVARNILRSIRSVQEYRLEKFHGRLHNSFH